jgi:ABC-type nitrate/sulfonate/bicarbonate transport system substrate-binding protein
MPVSHNHRLLVPALALLSLLIAHAARATEGLVLGNTHALLTGLIFIAQERGYFAAEDLQVDVVPLSTGSDGLEGIREGKLDLYDASDVTFVQHYHKYPHLRVISTLGEWNNETKILARADRGVDGPSDLRGKRIAVHRGLAMHWFLDRFLARNGLTEQDVQPVFLHLARQPAALAAGEVDALVSREPFLRQGREALGANHRLLEAPGLMIKRFVLITHQGLVDADGGRLSRLLRALVRAEHLVKEDPAQAALIIAGRLHASVETVQQQMKEIRLRLSLDDHLLFTLEKVARWWQGVDGRSEPRNINFLDVIKTGPLREAKPYGVLIRR